MTTTLTIYRLAQKHKYPRLKAAQSSLRNILQRLGNLLLLGLLKPTQKTEKVFARIVRSEAMNLNGAPLLNADNVFHVAIQSSEDPLRDRAEIKRLALSGLRWPHKFQIVWDDTKEVW